MKRQERLRRIEAQIDEAMADPEYVKMSEEMAEANLRNFAERLADLEREGEKQ